MVAILSFGCSDPDPFEGKEYPIDVLAIDRINDWVIYRDAKGVVDTIKGGLIYFEIANTHSVGEKLKSHN